MSAERMKVTIYPPEYITTIMLFCVSVIIYRRKHPFRNSCAQCTYWMHNVTTYPTTPICQCMPLVSRPLSLDRMTSTSGERIFNTAAIAQSSAVCWIFVSWSVSSGEYSHFFPVTIAAFWLFQLRLTQCNLLIGVKCK